MVVDGVPATHRIDLPYDASAATQARRIVTELLASWQLGHLVDSALLVVSELVGNAVRHGLPPVWLSMERVGERVRFVVHDDDACTLEAADGEEELPDLEAEGGRGLFIVSTVSEAHGCDAVPGDGKECWAVVAA